MTCTLVTALVDTGRGGLSDSEGRSLGTYLEWMELILSFPTPVVAFVSPVLTDQIRALREDRPIELIELDTDYFESDPLYPKIVELLAKPKPRPNRPECQLPLYNSVMFKKTHWVSQVAEENPFNTESFLWLDAGYGHGRESVQSYLGKVWPSATHRLADNKIHILQVHPNPRLNEKERFRRHKVFLAGGCFGGRKQAVQELNAAYQQTLKRTLSEGHMDDDQAVLGSVYLEKPEIFNLVGPTYGNYFEMLPYLSGAKVKRSAKGFAQDHPWLCAAVAGGGMLAYAWFARKRRHRNFPTFYRRAVYDVCDVLESVDARYWFTEGTLIALLRYGANEPEVDDDIDIMVEVENQEHWLELSESVKKALLQKGWGKGQVYSTFPKQLSRADKMQVKLKGDGCRTHLDLHSYLVDRERGVAYSHGHPNAYPFQHWRGFVPLELIYPFSRCLCYERAVPCPNRPFELLRHWHNDEYLQGALCFPRKGLTVQMERDIRERAQELKDAGYQSMTEELMRYDNL